MNESELQAAVRELMTQIVDTTYYVPYRDQHDSEERYFLRACADLAELGKNVYDERDPIEIAKQAIGVAYSILSIADRAAISEVMRRRADHLAEVRDRLVRTMDPNDVPF